MEREPYGLTPEQTAAIVGVSNSTLKAWRRTGRGPRWERLGHRTIRYDVADVLRLAAERPRD